ncbi:MAG TPA: hypothetical protein ENK86_03670 [Campylobacterales bacterium]|nr:hypothetical protein [Campylobacterales bacterium]
MKQLKVCLLAAMVASSTVSVMAEDYALTQRYSLIYDMKVAQKQQSLVIQMQELLNQRYFDVEALNRLQTQFDRQLHGLMEGDDSLRLNGTQISLLRTKLKEIRTVWEESQQTMQQASESRDQNYEAQQALNRLLSSVNRAVMAYDKSYQRYKQRSRLSAIVNRYQNHGKTDRLAFNTIH